MQYKWSHNGGDDLEIMPVKNDPSVITLKVPDSLETERYQINLEVTDDDGEKQSEEFEVTAYPKTLDFLTNTNRVEKDFRGFRVIYLVRGVQGIGEFFTGYIQIPSIPDGYEYENFNEDGWIGTDTVMRAVEGMDLDRQEAYIENQINSIIKEYYEKRGN